MFKKSALLFLAAGLLASPLVIAQAESAQTDVSMDTENDIVLRTEKGEVPANGIDTLEVDASIGQYNIIACDTDSIRWQLDLTVDEDEDNEYRHKLAEKFIVTAQREDGRYVISIERPDDDNNEDMNETIVESLTVHLPARLALAMNANIGEVTIDGVAGGVTLDFNIGEVTATVPRGAVEIDSNIGEVTLVTHTDSLGDVDLDANIGEVSFDAPNTDVEVEYNFPVGQELHLDNGGEDSIEIGLNIGGIDVEVE